MNTVLAAVVLVVGGFILGMWAAAKIYAFTFRSLRKIKTEITIEDREEGMIALVMRMPVEYRALAEKIVKKTKEKV